MVTSPVYNKTNIDLEKYDEFKQLSLANNTLAPQFQVDLLIGLDLFWTVITDKIIRSKHGLVALSSHLGWIISGPTNDDSVGYPQHSHWTYVCNLVTQAANKSLCSTVQDLWRLEALGITAPSQVPPDAFDYESYCDKISYENGHYTVKLPWKPYHKFLGDNYN